MAIVKTKKDDDIISTSLNENKVSDLKPAQPTSETEVQASSADTKKSQKGFFASTIEELKKVNWPNLQYVVGWGVVIIIFTSIFSISLGFFDNVFTNSVKFIDCTSPKGRNQQIKDCGTEFLEAITLRR